jgi:glutathione synthase/RimK-type ligase-like ATP-grasp enzyme
VNCFGSDIIDQLCGCSALLWHWEHSDHRAALFARQLIASVEAMGLVVFPGSATSWHYDDKLGQKYLLEAIGAPLVPTRVFYDERAALDSLEGAAFPLVWKLRGGAGSQNVRLVRSQREAQRIVRQSFRRGWKSSRLHPLQERVWQFRRDRSMASFLRIGRGVMRVLFPRQAWRSQPVEKGYFYQQEFVQDNRFDVRVVVIGVRAFAIKRLVRDGDFRASGSGNIVYDINQIPIECIRISFDVTRRCGAQCCAFDFVSRGGEWCVVEVSYAFAAKAYYDCPGYWDADLNWHEEPVAPERFMIEDVLSQIGAELPLHE